MMANQMVITVAINDAHCRLAEKQAFLTQQLQSLGQRLVYASNLRQLAGKTRNPFPETAESKYMFPSARNVRGKE
jgi:hypothetical protein